MTISAFVNDRLTYDGLPVGGRGARRRYKAEKRAEAQERKEWFDAEVARVARDQNISQSEARRVVVARKRFEHRRDNRQATS